MSQDLEQLTKGIGKVMETVPSLYEDALQPMVKEGGKMLARIPRAINAAFAGLDKWILSKEHNIEETKKLLAQKLQNIEPENIVEPEAYVAIPAIQAIAYSMSSEELRNLYANLLAKAMNNDTKAMVHPAYVEIIKQLSPIDAAIFKEIYWAAQQPLIDLSIQRENGGLINQIYNISWVTSYEPVQIRVSFDNLIRLGLIEVPFGIFYKDDRIYDMVRNTDFYSKTKEELEKQNLGVIHEEKKMIRFTSLAVSFYDVCIQE